MLRKYKPLRRGENIDMIILGVKIEKLLMSSYETLLIIGIASLTGEIQTVQCGNLFEVEVADH